MGLDRESFAGHAAFGTISSGIHRSFAQPVDNFSESRIPVDNAAAKSRPAQGDLVKRPCRVCPISGNGTLFIDRRPQCPTGPEKIHFGHGLRRASTAHCRIHIRQIGHKVTHGISVRAVEPRTGSLEG
jgi:hypothetical protein